MSQTEVRSSTLEIRQVANVLRIVGWLGFWVQLALTVGCGITLLFALSGRNFLQEASPGIGIGSFFASCSILVLLFGIYLSFRYTRLARRLRSPNPEIHPKKGAVMQLLRLGAIVGLSGMLLCILGGGATLGVLLAKSVAIPQGTAFYDPARGIRSLDIFVAMANMNGITANFISTLISLGLFNWLYQR